MMDFPTLTNCTVFPLPESTHLEFKATVSSCPFEKILATLCGLLNSGGGHLVVGVEDGTLRILGVKTDKTMDKFLLQVDNVYQQALIKKADGSALPVGAVKGETLAVSADKTLVVITVSAEPGEKYMLKDGTVWYRLSSSNYKQTAMPETNLEEELESLVQEKLASQEALLRAQFDSERLQMKQNLTQEFEKERLQMKQTLTQEFEKERRALELKLQTAQKAQSEANRREAMLKKSEEEGAKKIAALIQSEEECKTQLATLQKHLDGALLDKKRQLQHMQSTRDTLRNNFKKLEADFVAMTQAATKSDTSFEAMRAMIYEHIQLQRAEAEARLERERAKGAEWTAWFSSLTSCF